MRLLGLVCALALPSQAMGYSTRLSPTGRAFRWTSSSVAFRVDPVSLSMFPGDALGGARAAALAWTLSPRATRIRVEEGAMAGPGHSPGHSLGAPSSNALFVYRTGFPLATSSLAVTVVSSSVDTGEIYDADVLVQASRYRFEQLGPLGVLSPSGAPFDFQSMLTHEFGHVLGLGEDYAERDATMFPTAMPGAVTQRSLTMTDVESLSAAYAQEGPSASPDCSARVSPTQPRGLVSLAFLAGAALFLKRRRTRETTRWAVTTGAALTVLWALPVPTVERAGEATVIHASAHAARGLIFTTAVIEQGGARREITLLGGELGGLRQDVMDAASGAELRPGARLSIDHGRVLSVSVPIGLRGDVPAASPPDD